MIALGRANVSEKGRREELGRDISDVKSFVCEGLRKKLIGAKFSNSLDTKPFDEGSIDQSTLSR